MGPPALIAVNHDDYHAKHIGRTADGRQFFLMFTFQGPSPDREGNEFVALYMFDQKGKFLEAKIDEFGPRDKCDHEKCREVYAQRLRELGSVTFTRIEIEPFQIERFGTTFGLIAEAPDADVDRWIATTQPDNCMAFFEPWDSGEYDT